MLREDHMGRRDGHFVHCALHAQEHLRLLHHLRRVPRVKTTEILFIVIFANIISAILTIKAHYYCTINILKKKKLSKCVEA